MDEIERTKPTPRAADCIYPGRFAKSDYYIIRAGGATPGFLKAHRNRKFRMQTEGDHKRRQDYVDEFEQFFAARQEQRISPSVMRSITSEGEKTSTDRHYASEDRRELALKRDQWQHDAQRYGLMKVSPATYCRWAWLLGLDNSTRFLRVKFNAEHPCAFLDETGRRYVLSTPYHFDTSDMKELAVFCEEHQLEAEITSRMPLDQGKTVTLIIKESLSNFRSRYLEVSA